ncbi:MAG: Cell division protein FtsQ [Chlamydiae bacterium]|nr:Cell division protein FtsQ [Chlamydiota bacterium]
MLPTKNKLPVFKALFYIALSVFVFSGLPAFIWSSYCYHQKERIKDSKYTITKLALTGPVKEAIKSVHIEEILGLSSNKPQNIFTFNCAEAKKRLAKSGVIKKASISIEEPSTVLVEYTAREPVAYVADYTNLVMDQEGALFPLVPYYTPKRLPKVYFGIKIEPMVYGKFEDEKFEVAQNILSYFEKLNLKSQTIQSIDVSNLRANSVGKQEVVVEITEELGRKNFVRYLRLTCSNYLEEIEHYLSLKQMSMPDDLIIDLRLLPCAYITPVSEASSI